MLASFPLPDNAGQVVSARYFSSDRSLVVLLYGGDIATVQLDGLDGGVGPVSFCCLPKYQHDVPYTDFIGRGGR